jgi:hypothetical protein
MAAGAVVHIVLRPLPDALRVTAAGIVALVVLNAAGMRWVRQMARLAGAPSQWRAETMAGIAVGVTILGISAVLSAIEPPLVQRAGGPVLPIHILHALLFTTATLIVTTTGSFAMGTAIAGRRAGIRAAIAAGPAGAAVFLLVVAVMYAFGWRVGAPDAGKRATMLVVTALGAIGAALTSGALLGRVLLGRVLPRMVAPHGDGG